MEEPEILLSDNQRKMYDKYTDPNLEPGLYVETWPRRHGFTTVLNCIATKLLQNPENKVWLLTGKIRESNRFFQRVHYNKIFLGECFRDLRFDYGPKKSDEFFDTNKRIYLIVDAYLKDDISAVENLINGNKKAVTVISNRAPEYPSKFAYMKCVLFKWIPNCHKNWCQMSSEFRDIVWTLLLAKNRDDCLIRKLPKEILFIIMEIISRYYKPVYQKIEREFN